MIGHTKFGAGAAPVLVLHDWLSDTSNWEASRPYLDQRAFQWVFADLRGYGKSRELAGQYTLAEAAGDVLALADQLGLRRFALVGHSMSALVALHLAQCAPDRVERVALLTPPPPAGFGADPAALAFLRSLALGDDAARAAGLATLWGERLSPQWLAFKVARWRATSQPEAVAAYIELFAQHGVPTPGASVLVPMLLVTGERDAETLRGAAMTTVFAPLCRQLTVQALADCGHYPMQEAPVLLATLLQRFLAGAAPAAD